VKLENLLWLLPVFFMLHEFEEIVMMKPWLNRNEAALQRRFPVFSRRLMPRVARLSTSAFAVAVGEEFLLLSVITLVCVEYQLYACWTGLLLGFFLHLLVHFGQFLNLRRYVPVILTSVLAAPYCIYAVMRLNAAGLLNWPQVAAWTVFWLAALAANLALALHLAGRFEAWLQRSSISIS
jgi:hypothetical protein